MYNNPIIPALFRIILYLDFISLSPFPPINNPQSPVFFYFLTPAGDLFVIHDTGAHAHSMGFQYNGKLRAPELLLRPDGATIHVVRERETLHCLYDNTHIPADLASALLNKQQAARVEEGGAPVAPFPYSGSAGVFEPAAATSFAAVASSSAGKAPKL